MSETVPHVMLNIVTGEQPVIQLTPKGGRTAAEAQAFLEGRLKEAERIDPQTCEFAWWYARAVDLYGIFEVPEGWGCSGKENFVRNVPDGSWVWEGDLPEHIYKALVERIEREADTYENYLKRPKDRASCGKSNTSCEGGCTITLSSCDFDRASIGSGCA